MMQAGRWDYPVFCHGSDFKAFWSELLTTNRKLLFILGLGFDPRMVACISAIREVSRSACDCHLIRWDSGVPNPHPDKTQENLLALEDLVADWAHLDTIEVAGRSSGSVARKLAMKYHSYDPQVVTDVIVDISSLPRELFFPLVKVMLTIADNSPGLNVHVVVAEDPQIDKSIGQEGDDPGFITGFRGTFDRQAEEHIPRVWAPVLGERHLKRLEKLYEFVGPSETCPIIPFPSAIPRRGDLLVLEYRTLLFDSWGVDPIAVMYASESNPFDLYRRLRRLQARYESVLAPIGGAKIAVSPLSSKLLSVGVLLAALEGNLGVPYVGGQYHLLDGSSDLEFTGDLFEAWLAGEPYGE